MTSGNHAHGRRRRPLRHNVAEKLFAREMSSNHNPFKYISRFQNLHLMEAYSIHHLDGISFAALPLPSLSSLMDQNNEDQSSSLSAESSSLSAESSSLSADSASLSEGEEEHDVDQLLAVRGIIFARENSGTLAVFSQVTKKRIGVLNEKKNQFCYQMIYNPSADSIITLSTVDDHENDVTSRCISTRVEDILRGQLQYAGITLFESLEGDLSVVLDSINANLHITNSDPGPADDMIIHRVFDLKNYEPLYTIKLKLGEEIKSSPGILLIVDRDNGRHVHVKLLSAEDGTVMPKVYKLSVVHEVDFLELMNEKLFFKEQNENLRMMDLCNHVKEVADTRLFSPAHCEIMWESQVFLTYTRPSFSVWSFKGEALVKSFEDHVECVLLT